MRRTGFLLLIIAGCSRAASAPPTTDLLLDAAHRAIGPALDTVRTLWTVASVQALNGPFEVRVAAHRDGRVRLELGPSLTAGIGIREGWQCDSGGRPVPLDSVTRTVVRGHELHMLALAPMVLLRRPHLEPNRRWGTDSAFAVGFDDDLGAPLLLYLRLSDTLPVGLQLVNHTGSGPREVDVYFSDWETRDGLRLFRHAVFVHGENRFEYTFTQPTANVLDDSAFAPGCARRAGAPSPA